MSFAWWMAIYTRLICFNFKGNCFCSESNDKHKLMLKGVKSKRMFLVIKKKYLFPNALIVCKFIKCMTSFTPIGDSSWSSYFSCCWIDLNKIIARVPECVENPRGHRVYHTYNIIVTLTNQNNVHLYNHTYRLEKLYIEQ